MSAQVKLCYLCPRCDAGITSLETTFACPACGLPLGKQHQDPYTPPYTFTEQHEKFKEREKLLDVMSGLPIDKTNSIMNDALLIIETISGKNNPVTDIREMVQLGKRIGEIAVAYEKYLEAGGKHYPSLLFKGEDEIKQQQQKPIIIPEIQYEPKNTVVSIASPEPPTPSRRDP